MSHSRKHKFPQPAIGKKELERQQRQTAARQRMRFHTIVALTLMCCDKWRTNEALQEEIAIQPLNERKFLRMQAGKCHKRVQTVVQMLHHLQAWPAPNSAFFEDASSLMIDLYKTACAVPSCPDDVSYIEMHAMMTYLCYAALRDWSAMQSLGADPDSLCRRKEVQDMIRNVGIFSDHLIPLESPLVKPWNELYWQTRDRIHAGAPLPDWTRFLQEKEKEA